MNDAEMRSMLIDYMGRGFLDNIIALFRQDASLFPFIADMLGDDNIRVRLGATALVEELVRERRTGLKDAVPGLMKLLAHENPTIRGDAASVLGIIGDPGAKEALNVCLKDSHAGVREAAKEALKEIGDDGPERVPGYNLPS
jgi:HEAT repeat protein